MANNFSPEGGRFRQVPLYTISIIIQMYVDWFPATFVYNRHRINCPSIGEEHFVTVPSLHSARERGPVKLLISEFFF